MGSTRKSKKRNRSKGDSAEANSTNGTNSKRTKSVRELMKMDEETDVVAAASPMATSDSNTRVEVNTPKEQLFVEELCESPSFDDSTPKWAADLISSVKDLKKELRKVSDLASNTNKALEGIINNNRDLSTKLSDLASRMETIELESRKLRNENIELRERMLMNEFHQRRNNLIFDGIPEPAGPESGYDCYVKVLQCIENIPGLDVSQIRVDRCHRLGLRQAHRPRGIIAKFNWYGDLITILKNRSLLPTGVFVNEDLPDDWVERRRILRPILLQARRTDKYRNSSYLSRDKLIIDGKAYTVKPTNNLKDLPKDIVPAESCERRDEHTIAFLGPHSIYSNFHPSRFSEGGVSYSCAEQMIQAEKCAAFGDSATLEKIMLTSDPYKMKDLGSRVKGYVKEVWHQKSKDIVKKAVVAKFTQNKNLAGVLRSSGTLLIVEASPDKVWGTGVHLRNRSVLDRSKWNGNGIMSEILHHVRSLVS